MSTGYNSTIDVTFTLVPLNNAAGNLVATSLTSPTLVTSMLAGSSTITLLNTTATTINEFGAATTVNRGGAGITENIGKNTGNSTVNIYGNGTSGTTTITTNVTSGTANLFAGVTGTVNIGAVGSTTNFAGTIKQNGIVVPNLVTMMTYQLAL